MEENKNSLYEEVEKKFNQDKFEEVITSLTDEILEKQKDPKLYELRGNAWNKKKDYDKAIADFDKAIEINPDNAVLYVLKGNTFYYKENYKSAIEDYSEAIILKTNFTDAYYNRGLAHFAKKDYVKAIADYTKAIKLKSDYKDTYYNDRGNAKKAQQEYKEAIDDYTKAIDFNTDFENAYYNRGLARKEANIDLKGSKHDFEKYLELAIDEDEIWTKYAKKYIEELNEQIGDPKLWDIRKLVKDIKKELLITEECVHYTSFSVLKKLIIKEEKFRISEGNFMNDPNEGKEFYRYLDYIPINSRSEEFIPEHFSPKPFIGSFVTQDNNNDLNMWRFYGKEEGVEAKGCAITLRSQEFINTIKDSLSNETNKGARQDDESDINFYRVVYVEQNGSTKFYISELDKIEKLGILMQNLEKKVKDYNVKDKTLLEKHLNGIAFLFKCDSYRNENEIRLIVKGIEFKKKYNIDVTPPLVYIELEPIKHLVSKITMGPKVDKVSEWQAVFHYLYKDGEKAPKIIISHLPYK